MAIHFEPLELANYSELGDAVPDLVREVTLDLDRRAGTLAKGRVHFSDERKVRCLMFLARFGQAMRAAQYAGVSFETVRMERKNNEVFAQAWADALEIYRESLEIEAHKRAIDGWDEPVYQKGELAGTIHRKSERMLELLLKANWREKFGDNVKVDQQVSGGVLLIPTALSPDDWEKQYGPQSLEQQRAIPPTIEGTVKDVE